MRPLSLSDLKPGQFAKIVALKPASGTYRQTLLSMGLLPGTCIQFVRRAPLGDPIEIACRGMLLSLRAAEATMLLLEEEI